MLNVIMLNFVMLSFVAPRESLMVEKGFKTLTPGLNGISPLNQSMYIARRLKLDLRNECEIPIAGKTWPSADAQRRTETETDRHINRQRYRHRQIDMGRQQIHGKNRQTDGWEDRRIDTQVDVKTGR